MFKILLYLGLTSVFAQTVPQLDVNKYLGRWYQAYSDLAVDLTFENRSYCVTADYGMYPNKTISVLNRERYESINGNISDVYGWADNTNTSEPGQLTVHLQTAPFPAPYWVYELGPDTYNGSLYEYSVVSDPYKLTLFVLARNITTFEENWESGVLERLNNLGFNRVLNTPIKTIQEGCNY